MASVTPLSTSTLTVPQAFVDAAKKAHIGWYHCLIPRWPRARLARAADMYEKVASSCDEPFVRATAACRAYDLTLNNATQRAKRQKIANEAILALRTYLGVTLVETFSILGAPEVYSVMRFEKSSSAAS